MSVHTIKYLDGHTVEVEAESFRGAVEKIKADLSWANLSEANLRGANLSEANLSEANLSEADLSWANLSEANLSGADLSWSNLSEANLRGANLSEANLSEANLRGADLSGADLREANLSWADLDYSNWPLWCGSLNVRIDERIARQLMYHTLRAMQSVDAEAAKAILRTPEVVEFANGFHRVAECGKIKAEEVEEAEND